MITKEEFLKKYNISRDLFEGSEMSWEDCCKIYDDFREKIPTYEKIRNNFVETYLRDMDKKDFKRRVNVHSVRTRIKDPEHLIAKIIRKKQENYAVYRPLDQSNYEKIVRDLIGIRCLLVFKTDWTAFHHYITSQFENNEAYYVRDALRDFDEDENHYYMAEGPKVHLRNGDRRKIYEDEKLLSPGQIFGGKTYRAVHYIIKFQGVYLEIQVRTLFEEGWSEVDHAIVYPYYKDDSVFKEYTELLNRLSGLADEMGDFFDRLKVLEEEYLKTHPSGGDKDGEKAPKKKVNTKERSLIEQNGVSTAADCLRSVLVE